MLHTVQYVLLRAARQTSVVLPFHWELGAASFRHLLLRSFLWLHFDQRKRVRNHMRRHGRGDLQTFEAQPHREDANYIAL